MWEGARPRWQCVSQHMYQLTCRYREQVESSHRPSHIGCVVHSRLLFGLFFTAMSPLVQRW